MCVAVASCAVLAAVSRASFAAPLWVPVAFFEAIRSAFQICGSASGEDTSQKVRMLARNRANNRILVAYAVAASLQGELRR